MSEGPRQSARSLRPPHNPREILDADQFGDLGGDYFHRILRRVQPVSRAEQRADLPDLVVGRLVYDRDQLVACQKLRELLVRDPPVVDTFQERRGNQDYTRTRL